jgi:hypothetical protein
LQEAKEKVKRESEEKNKLLMKLKVKVSLTAVYGLDCTRKTVDWKFKR